MDRDTDKDRAADMDHETDTDHDTHDEIIHLACDPQAVRSSRRRVALVLRGRGWNERDVERAQLATSELVTNAVVHARTPATLRLRVGGPGLRLEVTDAAPAQTPVISGRDRRRAGGLGLPVVAALSRAWGVDRRAATKAVWCELLAAFPFRGGPTPGYP